MGWLVFMGWVISQANEVGGSFQLFLERGPRIGSPATVWSFVLGLGTVSEAHGCVT